MPRPNPIALARSSSPELVAILEAAPDVRPDLPGAEARLALARPMLDELYAGVREHAASIDADPQAAPEAYAQSVLQSMLDAGVLLPGLHVRLDMARSAAFSAEQNVFVIGGPGAVDIVAAAGVYGDSDPSARAEVDGPKRDPICYSR